MSLPPQSCSFSSTRSMACSLHAARQLTADPSYGSTHAVLQGYSHTYGGMRHYASRLLLSAHAVHAASSTSTSHPIPPTQTLQRMTPESSLGPPPPPAPCVLPTCVLTIRPFAPFPTQCSLRHTQRTGAFHEPYSAGRSASGLARSQWSTTAASCCGLAQAELHRKRL